MWPGFWGTAVGGANVATVYERCAHCHDNEQRIDALTAENTSLRRHNHTLANQVAELTRINASYDRGILTVPTGADHEG